LTAEGEQAYRDTVRSYVVEFEEKSRTAIAPLSGVNRSIKINLVTDSFFKRLKPDYHPADPNCPCIYIRSDLGQFEQTVVDLLCYEETTSVFHLTYQDFMSMSPAAFEYAERRILELVKLNIEKKKKMEQKVQKE
jgi:hypothetical protein